MTRPVCVVPVGGSVVSGSSAEGVEILEMLRVRERDSHRRKKNKRTAEA
jgi:hypothetical protein